MLGAEGNFWNLQAPLSFAFTFDLPVLLLGLTITLTTAPHGILPLDLSLMGNAFLSPLVWLTVGCLWNRINNPCCQLALVHTHTYVKCVVWPLSPTVVTRAGTFQDHSSTAAAANGAGMLSGSGIHVICWGGVWAYGSAQTQLPSFPFSLPGEWGGVEMADELTLHLCEVWRWGFHGLLWLLAPISPEEQAALKAVVWSFLSSLPDLNLLLELLRSYLILGEVGPGTCIC